MIVDIACGMCSIGVIIPLKLFVRKLLLIVREDTNLLDIAIQEPPQHRIAEATRATRYQ